MPLEPSAAIAANPRTDPHNHNLLHEIKYDFKK
jgi:hypothetical protein